MARPATYRYLMASLTIQDLTKSYDGRVPALSDFSLDVPDGSFVVLLGPSGCGKSTVLRCIAGLETPDRGRISIGGEDVTSLPPGDRNVAMVFQSYALYPHLTVRENLEFPLRMRRVNPPARASRVREVAAKLELGELLERFPAQLSGGQRQRVALGRALVREPALFLLDEPLSNLDASLRAQLRADLMALHQTVGATMLYVTHDQVEALTMAQRLVVLRQGRLEQSGTPDEIYQRPATTFVAGFVGTPGMNLVPVERAGDLLSPGNPPGATTAGFRPEHIVLTEPVAGREAAEIRLVERLGPESLVHLRLEGTGLIARVPGSATFTPGQPVTLSVHPAHLHWFDASGRRID